MLLHGLAARPSVRRLLVLIAACLLVMGFASTLTPTYAGAEPADNPGTPLTTSATAITTGGSHSCALMPVGAVQCWGRNFEGQLGDGNSGSRSTPITVAGISGATAISASTSEYTGGFSCALMSDGTVKCWGVNNRGQLGTGTTTDRSTPIEVTGIAGATAISTGGGHSCALMPGGTIKCWGQNSQGRLGDGTTTDRSTPVEVTGIAGATAISTGGGHSCALMPGGTIKCWGGNGLGALGDGSTTDRSAPVEVTGVTGSTVISAGSRHTCALMADGTVKCWGGNDLGQLGDGTRADRLSAVSVHEISGATAVSSGQGHTCALLSGGTVKCWGYSLDGRLGDGAIGAYAQPTPVDVVDIAGASQIGAGGSHSCALMPGGAIKCWGSNDYGALGSGSSTYPRFAVSVVRAEDDSGPTDPEEPNNCSDIVFVGVRGSGESPQDRSLADYEASPGAPVYSTDTSGLGDPLGRVLSEFESQMTGNQPGLPAVQVRAVAYPAISVEPQIAYPLEYGRSVRVGANQLASALRQIKSECAQARVALAGYSQGADVINTVMADVQRSGEKSLFGQVEKIVVLGDPAHRPNRAENIGNWWTLGSSNGYGVTEPIADNGTFTFKDANPDLVSSICFIGDLVCDTSSAAVHVGVQVHQMYSALTMECPAVNKAWQFGTTCAAQTLFQGLGYTPSTRQGGLYADQMVAQTGTHIWASIVAVIDIKSKITKLTGWFKSDPIEIGTFDINEHGTAVIEFDIPDVPAGQHHLELVGDDGRMYRIPIYVTDEPVVGDSLMFTVDGSAPTVPPATDPTNPSDPTDPGGTGSIGSSGSPFGS
uniref:RCC1 domain-containing protein n=1 Tax=Rhodococcus qingshengii TaxID=334542 RepID=UPI001C4DFCCF|nr:cutinase family protein [Rhodococcus qingshengii]